MKTTAKKGLAFLLAFILGISMVPMNSIPVKAAKAKAKTITFTNVNTGKLTLYRGQKYNLNTKVTPTKAKKNIVYSSSRKKVLSVNSKGVLKAKKSGTSIVTAKDKTGKKRKKLKVTVVAKKKYKKIKSLTFTKKTYSILPGASADLTLVFSPVKASNKNVIFSSSNKGIVTVTASGKITGIKPGSAKIIASALDGSHKKAVATVAVGAKVSSLRFPVSEYTIGTGKTYTIKTEILPKNASNKKLKWTSSEPTVASVDQTGKVKGIEPGYAEIKAQTLDGSNLSATFEINVNDEVLYIYDEYYDRIPEEDTIQLYEGAETVLYYYAFEQGASGELRISSTAGSSLNTNVEDEERITLIPEADANNATVTFSYGSLKKTYTIKVLRRIPIHYNTNGGEALESTSTYENTKLLLPIPYREKYVFKGWYLDAGLTEKINEDTILDYKEDGYTLYADWEPETLEVNVDESAIEAKDISIGLTGTYATNSDIDEITFKVIDENGDEKNTGSAIIGEGEWNIEKLGISPGTNTIQITAKAIGGTEASATCTVTYDRGEIDTNVTTSDIVGMGENTQSAGVPFVKDRIVLIFHEDYSDEDARYLIDEIGGTVIGNLNTIGLYQVQLDREFGSTEEILEYADNLMDEYQELASAAPEYIEQSETEVTYNDPWNSSTGGDWWYKAVNGPEAWDYIDKMKSVRIGVIDDGFDRNHEDLTGRIRFVSDTRRNEANVEDHGTHVAGIIGATPNNGIGLAGLAHMNQIYAWDWYPSSSQNWNTSTKIQDSYVEAIENGCKVVTMSLGIRLEYEYEYLDSGTVKSQGKSASTALGKLLEKGFDFNVVQSAGNGGHTDGLGLDAINNGHFSCITRGNCYSSDKVSKDDILNRIFIVAAAEQNGSSYRMTDFSNGGSQVNIAAPGENIYSSIAFIRDTRTNPHNLYANYDGTSMAAPIVASVASMVWAINHNFTGAEVQDIVLHSTKDRVADNTASSYATGSFPMVNAQLAVKEALNRGGTVKGTFTDAETGNGVKATYKIHKDDASGQVVNDDGSSSAQNGTFNVVLPAGKYVFEISASGYVPTLVNVDVPVRGTKDMGAISLTKDLSPNAYRIILNWGENPYDLDSHARAVSLKGGDVHVFYSNQYENEMNLDRDDTDSYGPETITIPTLSLLSGFRYAVHNYSDRDEDAYSSAALNLANSGATVSIFKGSRLLRTFTVPRNRKGTVWTVFSLSSLGTVNPINTMGFESDPDSVLTSAFGSGFNASYYSINGASESVSTEPNMVVIDNSEKKEQELDPPKE